MERRARRITCLKAGHGACQLTITGRSDNGHRHRYRGQGVRCVSYNEQPAVILARLRAFRNTGVEGDGDGLRGRRGKGSTDRVFRQPWDIPKNRAVPYVRTPVGWPIKITYNRRNINRAVILTQNAEGNRKFQGVVLGGRYD